MALKFLNKKGWHTGSLRNLENVWKAEQKHETEQKKLEELRAQIHKEREAEELRQLHVSAGIAPRQERLEFLYDSGVGASSSKPSIPDDHKPVNATLEPKKDNKSSHPSEKFAPAIPGALFTESNPASANDKWRKIHSDPLYLIKQQELAALDRIRKNPVKMHMLENQVRNNLRVEKERAEHDKDDRRHKKKRDREDGSSKRKRHGADRNHEKERHRDDPGVKAASMIDLGGSTHGDQHGRHRNRHDRYDRDDAGGNRKKHRYDRDGAGENRKKHRGNVSPGTS